MDDYGLEILTVSPVHGDWFCVLMDGGDWYMERVRCWCTVHRGEDGARWVTGLGEGVSPIVHPVHGAQPGAEFFVCGDDVAPNGTRWREVFNDPPVNARRIKCVNHVMRQEP